MSALPSELCFQSITQLAKLLRSRKLSPTELVHAYLRRIEAINPQLDAFITVTASLALDQAKAAEREIAKGRYRGPLHGIPYGLKDIFDTAGIATTGHSRVAIDRVPGVDAATVRRLHEAGAILLGKLATHEFAHGGPSFDLPWPPARNPWRLDRFTGGSSSGSAAATAAGLVAGSLGSDTGGSIRGPASYCGVVGLMGSSGLVSRAGVLPNSFTLDRCGPIARTVEDAAILLQAIAGFDANDPGSLQAPIPHYRAALKRPVKRMRIGALRYVWEEELPQPAEVSAAMDGAVRVFRDLGVVVEDVRLRSMREYNDVKIVIAESELFAIHHRDLAERPEAFGEDFLSRVLPACLFSAGDYVQASRAQRRMMSEYAAIRPRYDALLSIVFGPAPPLIGHDPTSFWRRANAQPMANVLGAPAIALPNGFTAEGLPLGMQLVGFPFEESRMLRLAHAYERFAGWHDRHPQRLGGAAAHPLTPTRHDPLIQHELVSIDRIRERAYEAGLRLNERQLSLLAEAAPHALAMSRRLERNFERSEAPAITLSVNRMRFR